MPLSRRTKSVQSNPASKRKHKWQRGQDDITKQAADEHTLDGLRGGNAVAELHQRQGQRGVVEAVQGEELHVLAGSVEGRKHVLVTVPPEPLGLLVRQVALALFLCWVFVPRKRNCVRAPMYPANCMRALFLAVLAKCTCIRTSSSDKRLGVSINTSMTTRADAAHVKGRTGEQEKLRKEGLAVLAVCIPNKVESGYTTSASLLSSAPEASDGARKNSSELDVSPACAEVGRMGRCYGGACDQLTSLCSMPHHD